MPNQEDYLDNLLGSIEDVRTHSSNEAKKTEDKSKKNNMDRRAISPKDDFLEASGLSKYEPVKIERQNLKMALSQDDFIKNLKMILKMMKTVTNFFRNLKKNCMKMSLMVKRLTKTLY